GDGGWTAIDPTAADKTAYAEAQFAQITRFATNTNVNTSAGPCDSLDSFGRCVRSGTPESTPFIAPFVMDPTNKDVMIGGIAHAYKTTTASTQTGGVAGWPTASGDLTFGGGEYISTITANHATTGGTPLIVLTGSLFGKVYESNDGGATYH